MAQRFVGFGDLLLRLDAKLHSRLVQAEEFAARYTGAEANVAVSLALFGWSTWVVSKVPAHEIGDACIAHLRRHGVQADFIARGGDRLGILYVETGAAQRPTKVVYDRTGSSFRTASPEDFDWSRILEGKDWFHASGTAPASGPGVLEILEEGLAAAGDLGLTVSIDCNYRSKLWSAEAAGRTIAALLPSADLFLASPHYAAALFGIAPEPGLAALDAARRQAAELSRRFGLRAVAMTLRDDASASHGRIQGLLHADGDSFASRAYEFPIVDRIGAGDAFAAGVIHGLACGWKREETVEFATAAACLKHSIPGDFNLVTVEEVRDVMGGGGEGRVSR
ncbi:MAG: PfkB family carbohydrate kinase [Planctomycetota bacterium]